MADTITVRSRSIFHGSAEGRTILLGEEFDVTPDRAAELKANSLIEPYGEASTGEQPPAGQEGDPSPAKEPAVAAQSNVETAKAARRRQAAG